MAKFVALSLLVSVLALCAMTAVSAQTCKGAIVTTGCRCKNVLGPAGVYSPKCQDGLLCAKVKLLGVKTSVCVLPGLCNKLDGLGLGCNCDKAKTKCSNGLSCYVPAVGAITEGLGLGNVLPGLLNGILGNGICCDPYATKDIPMGCSCSEKRPCRAGFSCQKGVRGGILALTLLDSICVRL